MSNLDKAVEVLREAYREPSMSPVHSCVIMASALEAAGLLAPDLPEPYREGVFKVSSPHLDVRSVQAAGEQIILHGYKSRHATIIESRRLALAILAACEHAEKEQGNE